MYYNRLPSLYHPVLYPQTMCSKNLFIQFGFIFGGFCQYNVFKQNCDTLAGLFPLTVKTTGKQGHDLENQEKVLYFAY